MNIVIKILRERKGSKRIQNGVGEQMKEKNLCSIACMNESIQYKQSIFFFERFFDCCDIPNTHINGIQQSFKLRM